MGTFFIVMSIKTVTCYLCLTGQDNLHNVIFRDLSGETVETFFAAVDNSLSEPGFFSQYNRDLLRYVTKNKQNDLQLVFLG